MARRKLAFMAGMGGLLAPTLAQSSSESCYWTSTVIYGGQSTMQTFSSMNPPLFSSSSSSAGTGSDPGLSTNSGTTPTVVVSSTTSTSATSSIIPSIPPDQPFIVEVVVSARRVKRDTQYISFSGEFAILVDDQTSAAIFDLSADGYLTTDVGNFFGPSSECENCKVPFLKDEMPPSSPPTWNHWFSDASGLRYDNSTFCIATNHQLFVVFGDDGSDDCQGVSFVGELTADSTSATSTSGTTATPSVTASSTISDTMIIASSESLTTPTEAPSSTTLLPQSSISSLAIQSSSTSSSLPSSGTTILPSSSSPISATTHTTTVSTYFSSSTSSVATSPSLPTSRTSAFPSSSPKTSPSNTASSVTASMSQSSSLSSSISGSPSSSSGSKSSSSSSSPSPSTSTFSSSSSVSPSSSASTSTLRPSSSSLSTSSSTTISSPTIPSSSVSPSTSPSTSTSTSRFSTTTATSTSSASPTPNILPGKRGLAYSNVNLTYYYPPPTQVSWAYNYYYAPNSSSSPGIFPRTSSYPLRFFPLLFNDDPSLATNWLPAASYAIANYGSDALFSFNEPDFCVGGSACMTVQRALVGYNKSMQPFAGQTRLVAPAVTNAGSGFSWLRDFLGNASLPQWNLTIDIINIHWYASPYNMQYFIDYMTNASVIANGRPIWITEYGMDNNNYYEPHVQQFMKNTTYWCDRQSFIERYAWFGNYPNNLLNATGTALGPRGVIWNNYTGGNYVYGFPARLAGSVEEAKEVRGPDAGEVEEAKELGKDGDESEWKREGFVERMWWKGDGHMDGK